MNLALPGLTLFIEQENHDWPLLNNYNIHYISAMLSPHPADPTLTTDNLMEVVKGVEHRWRNLGNRLGVIFSNRDKISRLYHSDQHRMQALADHYTTHHPTPSWNSVARALRGERLYKQADEVTTKYVKGMDVNHVTCLILIQAVDGQLWY